MRNPLARLASAIEQLPIPQNPQRTLNIGCGDFLERHYFRQKWRGWLHVGVDVDEHALARTEGFVSCVQADAQKLPFQAQFSFILIRQPDVDRLGKSWAVILRNVGNYLIIGGSLLVSAYALHEYTFIQKQMRSVSLASIPLEISRLAPVNLIGNDRYLLAYTTTSL